MKIKIRMASILAMFLFALTQAFAHSEHELGPNGGRILEFSKDQSIHGEVTLTNGMFHVGLLDQEMKPLAITEQTLVVTGGSRARPEKPKVEIRGNQFVFPALKEDNYLLVFQFREKASGKPITARFEYDNSKCGACRKEEWLCDCGKKK